jgi:hypothetical protein
MLKGDVLSVSGSLRRGSYNTALLREAANALPSGVGRVWLGGIAPRRAGCRQRRVHAPGEWMSGMLSAGDRAQLSTADAVGGSVEERALAFSTYLAYCGGASRGRRRRRRAPDRNEHVPELCRSRPASVLRALRRRVLRTPPLAINGEVIMNELRWVREE